MGIFGVKKDSQDKNQSDDFIKVAELDQLFSVLIINSNLNIVYANEQFKENFGFTTSELKNLSIHKIQAKLVNHEQSTNFWTSVINDKFSACVEVQNKSKRFVSSRLKIIQKDNGYFWLLFDTPDETDDPFGKLKESMDLHLELINSTPDIICFKDGEGRWLLANQADLELFHLVDVEYFGKTDEELAHFTHEVYKDSFLNCMQTDEICWNQKTLSRSDELIEKPDGSNIILDVIKVPIFNEDGSRKNLIVLGRDVTARRKAESELVNAMKKAEESDKLKSNFLATMSHELRTPLNAVIGFSDLIYDEDDIHEIHDYSRIINNNSKVLLNLIEDIFDVSLIESDQVEIANTDFDILKAIKEVYEIFPVELNKLNKHNIDFKLLLPKESITFKGDEFRLKQILTNLIRNALKFTTEGFIHLKVEVIDNYINISVEDSGIGISEEKKSEIFESFRQVEEGYNRSFNGAGLGLSISKRLAEMMNGDIMVESELGKGSTFTLRLFYNPIQ
jgi:PAS domain S-box-containing protein